MQRPEFESLLCYNLALGWRLVNAFYKPYLPEGISPQQTYVLECCFMNQGIHMGDLAACIELDLAAVSALVSRMEKQELLSREIDTANRRHIKVYLTGKGKRIRDQVAKSLTMADKKIFKLVRKEDFKGLRSVIQVLRQVTERKEINSIPNKNKLLQEEAPS